MELEALRAARQRITDPADWLQCYPGRYVGANRNPVCIRLAVDEVTDFGSVGSVLAVLREHVGGVGNEAIYAFNDSHTHAEVLQLLDDVICKLEEQEAGPDLAPLAELVEEPAVV